MFNRIANDIFYSYSTYSKIFIYEAKLYLIIITIHVGPLELYDRY